MYDDEGRAQAGRDHGDKLLVGNIQDTSGNSPGVSFCHQFEARVLMLSSQGAPPVTGLALLSCAELVYTVNRRGLRRSRQSNILRNTDSAPYFARVWARSGSKLRHSDKSLGKTQPALQTGACAYCKWPNPPCAQIDIGVCSAHTR